MGNGRMASAERVCCCAKEARVWAACVGELGADVPEVPGESTRRLLIASACRLGGPRRRLGRSNVQGISKPAHALHGGPDSSH